MVKKWKKEWVREFKRQLFHLGLGLLFLGVIFGLSVEALRYLTIVLLVCGFGLSSLVYNRMGWILNDILKEVERKNEIVPGEGAFYFVMGVGLTSWVFSDPLVIAGGIIALTFQDSMSTLIGMRFGQTKIVFNKSIEGSTAGFLLCMLALLPIFPLPIAFQVALIATAVELFPLNDALTIPLVTAFALQTVV